MVARWEIDKSGPQPVLTHYCDQAHPNDTSAVLRQDLGGGYVRCERCGEKYLPGQEPGNPRWLLRLKRAGE